MYPALIPMLGPVPVRLRTAVWQCPRHGTFDTNGAGWLLG